MPDLTGVLLGALALAMGGVLKGATGVGAPILAVPLLSWFYGVPAAITLFALPNLFANALQSWQFRRHQAPAALTWPFAVAGLIGAGVGTLILVSVSSDRLLLVMAFVVMVYIVFRLARPEWSLAMRLGVRLATPAGFAAGVLFGAVGISSPISMTFLNALRMERPVFISTISIFFVGMAFTQVPILIAAGVMTPQLAAGSVVAIAPIWAAMPLGAWLARLVTPAAFDKIILALLGLIAVRLLIRGLM